MQDAVQQTPEKPARTRLSASEEVRYGALLVLAAGALNTFVFTSNAPVGRVGCICALLILISGPATFAETAGRATKVFLSGFFSFSTLALMLLAAYGWGEHSLRVVKVTDSIEDVYFVVALALAFVLPRLHQRSLSRAQEVEA